MNLLELHRALDAQLADLGDPPVAVRLSTPTFEALRRAVALDYPAPGAPNLLMGLRVIETVRDLGDWIELRSGRLVPLRGTGGSRTTPPVPNFSGN